MKQGLIDFNSKDFRLFELMIFVFAGMVMTLMNMLMTLMMVTECLKLPGSQKKV